MVTVRMCPSSCPKLCMISSKKSPSRLWKILALVLCAWLVIILATWPLVTEIVYESIFQYRFETESWRSFSVREFDGLQVQRSDFYAENGQRLAGYLYEKGDEEKKGVLVFAHGYGTGGHNGYLPLIDYFAGAGYYVFAYDARGTDQSEGEKVEGLPQGIHDLDCAIDHVKTLDPLMQLPMVLMGHSWGGYCVGSVLNLHPEVEAAVILAGFNETEDMLYHQAREYVWILADLTMSSVKRYEDQKFGAAYADLTAIAGMASTDAQILVVQSRDDATVPIRYGYDLFYREFSGNPRFQFVLYEDRGHGYVFCSREALQYQAQLETAWVASGQNREQFMAENVDKTQYFALNLELMEQILQMFDAAVQ